CTDLDRTLLPNGAQPESPGARARFAVVATRPEVSVAYVSGRHRALVEQAIKNFRLPVPDYVIGDVGTTIYQISGIRWQRWQEWEQEIGPDWGDCDHQGLVSLFRDLSALHMQEKSKQNTHKLSYYVSLQADRQGLLKEMGSRLDEHGVAASLVWSIDDPAGIGLLDVLPAHATKLHSIEFLMRQKGFTHESTVFAGDSGNDLPVLVSPISSVLVGNASDQIKRQALDQAATQGTTSALYVAKGDYRDMNGNYSAGILEGLSHYFPETEVWWD
ncbi:MAG: HAD-IIB family hydrolase, partial [Pseudomonadota bacterium]